MLKDDDIDQYKPERITIVPDEFHVEWVGKTFEGIQFFINTLFEPAKPANNFTRLDFIAVFLWNQDGSFKEAIIDNLGSQIHLNYEKVNQLFVKRIKELGEYEILPINVEPFKIEKFGIEFGLIYMRSFIDDDEDIYERVELHPGNGLAFNPPWDGDYDT